MTGFEEEMSSDFGKTRITGETLDGMSPDERENFAGKLVKGRVRYDCDQVSRPKGDCLSFHDQVPTDDASEVI